MKKISIILSGLGMGNSSRCEAVIQQLLLVDPKMQITIFTWGNGTLYYQSVLFKYRSNLNLVKLKKLNEGSFIKNVRHYFLNTLVLIQQFQKNKPDKIILDSDYHFLAYIFMRKRVYYISQAADVVTRFFRSRLKWTFKQVLSFVFLEYLDLCYQLIVAKNILVPCFHNKKFLLKKIISIPLIVRSEFLSFNEETTSLKQVGGVLLSGSGLEFEKVKRVFIDKNVKFISPETGEHFQVSTPELFNEFKYVVTQGGLSSISEIISLQIPLLVFPISNHVEQKLNAFEVENSGLGIEYTLEKSLEDQLSSISKMTKIQKSLKPNLDGAAFVAKFLLK